MFARPRDQTMKTNPTNMHHRIFNFNSDLQPTNPTAPDDFCLVPNWRLIKDPLVSF